MQTDVLVHFSQLGMKFPQGEQVRSTCWMYISAMQLSQTVLLVQRKQPSIASEHLEQTEVRLLV